MNTGRYFTFLVFLTFLFTQLPAQEGYFQQEVNYQINVTLDDANHHLYAQETIEYINNSPDTLYNIYFHLWPNAYSGNETDLAKQIFRFNGRQKLFNDPAKRGWIDSLDFSIDQVKADFRALPDQPDIGILELTKGLLPGDTIIITTPFRVKIPQGNISRMGFNKGAYQVSQWYPKPAVYDKNGWHQMPYLDQGEFYSEFGKFDVTIKVPEGYVTGATGDLVSDNNSNGTLRFKGEDIHDFAFVTGKNFMVDSSKVILPWSGREVVTKVMFPPGEIILWNNALEYVNRSIIHFSEWLGDYPYNTFTAIQSSLAAGSGMEYPGMTIIGPAENAYSLDEVISHEICHSWFYSAIGTNERRYPYLDEGLTTAYEERYMSIYHQGTKLWELYFRNPLVARMMKIDRLTMDAASEIPWLVTARENTEQPLDLHSDEYSSRNYGNLVYYKAGKGYNYVRSFLGDSLFDQIMREYYSTWKFRHPSPDDLREIIESKSNKDLSWFFEDYIGTVKRYDYKVKKLSGDSLLVVNKGEMVSPLEIHTFMNGTPASAVWHEGFTGRKWLRLPDAEFNSVRLNASHLVPEIIHTNNNIRTSGMFPRADPMSPQLLASIEDPQRRTLLLLPLVNWNRADGFMAGIAMKNSITLPKRTEYFITPFFIFREPDFAGKGRITYNLLPYNSIIRKTSISLEGASFGATPFNDYHAIKPGIDFWFHKGHHIYGKYILATNLQEVNSDVNASQAHYWQAGYTFVKPRLVNPYSITALYEAGNDFGKISGELNYRFSFNGGNQGFDIRVYSATMTHIPPGDGFHMLAVSGRSGRELYLFQGDFPDRFAEFRDNFWSRQMLISEGALVTPLSDSTGYSRSLVSLSLASNLPGFAGSLPVKPFANLVYAPDADSQLYAETGFKAGIWNFLEFYMPLLVSDNISSLRGSLKERIRFTLNLEQFLRLRL